MNTPEDGFHAPLPKELAPLFPNYQILSLIAKGGMGSVYHAIQTSLEREIAVKILPVEFGKDPEFCKGFEAEAKAMAKLNHPNLISVYDFGEVDGMLFIAMEYVPGQSLHDACNGCAVDPAEVIRLMTGICQGLAHAHGHGILHRDIKPGNILLDSSRQPKVGDFGLARPLDVQVQDGETIFGTPGYTAPEVLEHPLTVDQRADIFSLGVLLHELLTGQLPDSDPRPPSAISQCDPRFDAVVRRATHPSPTQRYPSASEMADALQKIAITAGPKVMRTPSPAPPRPALARRHSKQSSKNNGGGMLVGLILVAAVAAAFLFRDEIFNKPATSPSPLPVVGQAKEPVIPVPIVPDPSSVEPEPIVSAPEPSKPNPVVEPVVPNPSPLMPEPNTEPGALGAVTPAPPKFDVDSFLAHARSVMIGRCGNEVVKHDEALKKNLSNFQGDALKLMKENLPENFHAAGKRELEEFVTRRQADGNRMGEELQRPLKFKKYLVELHQEHQTKEAQIDKELASVFAEPQKTYLYGLGIKIKALRGADDPAAAERIEAEVDRVTASPDYFPSLMLAAKKK